MKPNFQIGDRVRLIETDEEISSQGVFKKISSKTDGKIISYKENPEYVKYRFIYGVDFQGEVFFIRQGLLRKIK